MNADSPEEASLPSPQTHISSSSSGYSVPIRAPLTIDSDSEFDVSHNDHIYSRTSSFNSSISSIDISSFGDEHTSTYEGENSEEIVIERSCVAECSITRPFVRYPDAIYVKETCGFMDYAFSRPVVKVLCEESGGDGVGTRLSVPVAPLTRECDSDGDVDSVDGIVQKVTLAPKVKSFDADEEDDGVDDELRVKGVFSDEDIIGTENLSYVSSELVRNEGCKVVNLYDTDASSFDFERSDAHTVLSSNTEIDIDIAKVKLLESDELGIDADVICPKIVSNSDSEVESSPEVIDDDEGCKVEYLNEVVELSESGASSFSLERIDSLTSFDLKDSQTFLNLNNEIETETVNVKLSESAELGFDSDIIDTQIVSSLYSEIKILSNVSSELIENEGCKVECLNKVMKVYESGVSSFALERIDAKTVSSANNIIELETINAQNVLNSESEIENLSYISSELMKDERCKVECLNEAVNLSDSDASGIDLERIDAQAVSSSNNDEGCKVEYLNEVVKLSESGASSFSLERINSQASFDLEDSQTFLNSKNEIETETVNVKLSESDELGVDSDIIDTQIVSNSDSEIKILNHVSSELTENEGCKVECLNEAVNLSDSDASGIDLDRIDAQAISSSNNEIEISNINVKLSESDELSFDSNIEQEVARAKEREMLTRMQRIRAKFLRLALNEQLTTEVNGEGGNYKFDFCLTILAIGKTGVGKSATINSIFGENKAITNAFDPGTTTITEITGNVDGILLRVIDTPGLKCSSSDRSYNLRNLNSIKRFIRKHTPNVVLYVDRLDTRDVNDSDLLTLITSSLGSSVWRNCIIALTHASCELSRGLAAQRCHFIQEQIVRCGGNDRQMVNPVWLVDNDPSHKHDIMDLDCVLKALACLDHANEYDGRDQVSERRRDIINGERRNGYFMEYGFRVKLVGTNHWFLGCRMCL